MQLIPEEETAKRENINFAPMVDFLFLILAVFATLAITRFALYDSEVNLVKLKTETDTSADPAFNQTYTVNISITEEGRYKLLTDVSEIVLDGSQGIQREIVRQQQQGLLPFEKKHTRVLLHIDKNAKWEPIAEAIFAIREFGLQVSPVYEPIE